MCDTLGSIPSSTSCYKSVIPAQKVLSRGPEVHSYLQLFIMFEVSLGYMELCLRSDGQKWWLPRLYSMKDIIEAHAAVMDETKLHIQLDEEQSFSFSWKTELIFRTEWRVCCAKDPHLIWEDYPRIGELFEFAQFPTGGGHSLYVDRSLSSLMSW